MSHDGRTPSAAERGASCTNPVVVRQTTVKRSTESACSVEHGHKDPMKLYSTETDGYIGALLANLLAERGHDVTGCDIGFYRTGWLHNGVDVLPRTLNEDLAHLSVDDGRGHDAVMDLAEPSIDPVGSLLRRPPRRSTRSTPTSSGGSDRGAFARSHRWLARHDRD